MQGCEHLRNGHAACGVHHGGGYLAERREHECAAAHVGVRNGEAWRVEHDVVVEKHVDVDGAVGIPAVDTLAGTAQVALDALCDGKQGLTPEQFDNLMHKANALAQFMGKTV